ncbi:factor-independent urate hydroxylase [Actinosynnema sp. NPDC020468]|uniref:factor-independent urate hydroxylase n=1 Tax=Actinosynnema sp. NPDC020468 TaxID=3154488 RepID=UPI0033FC70E0
MAIVLGPNQYGKAGIHLVVVHRDGDVHTVRDLTVRTALRGDLAATHLVGDNTHVPATDTQKNTVHAFASDGVGEIEDFALRLARHFTAGQESITEARVLVDEQSWHRLPDNGHSFGLGGTERRTTAVVVAGDAHRVVSGVRDLVLLKTTGSEFHGFPRDRYTTLADTDDRLLATSVTARWRLQGAPDWAQSHAEARRLLVSAFATHHSLSLQHTLHAMGEAVLAARPEIAEVRLSMPNRHHFAVDLDAFGPTGADAVYHAADRPYGLIEGTVLRDDAEDAGPAWRGLPEF